MKFPWSPKPQSGPEITGKGIGNIISVHFSRTRFQELFDDQSLAEGWTTSDALAVWYSLGHFCFLTIWGSVTIEPLNVPTAMDAGFKQLLLQWKMPEAVHQKFMEFNRLHIKEIMTAYQAADDAAKFRQFFVNFVERIVGSAVHFASASLLETVLRGTVIVAPNLLLPTQVSTEFVTTQNMAIGYANGGSAR